MMLLFLVLDESISGWCPKTFKLGKIPNCTHEPRKQVPLGAMLKNVVECDTWTIVNNDVVQNPDQQEALKR